jgi:hypothetical protein
MAAQMAIAILHLGGIADLPKQTKRRFRIQKPSRPDSIKKGRRIILRPLIKD